MKKTFYRTMIYALLLGGAAFFALPLLWMVSTALKPVEQTMTTPPDWWPRRYSIERNHQSIAVRLSTVVSEPSMVVAAEGFGTPVILAEKVVQDGRWHLADGTQRPVKVLERLEASPENLWREVVAVDDGARYYVSIEQIRGQIAPRWGNFGEAIDVLAHFWRYLGNSVILCVLNVVGTVISSALAAYGFSRLEWRGRERLFLLLLATLMVPFPVVMVPLYSLFRALGWVGTMKPLWVGAFFAGAFNVFLLRQFFRTIPRELSEAARIDGCGEFRIFWQIILPLCRPALIVVGLFTFLGTWNDFLGPLIYLTDQKDFTLALALQGMQTKSGLTDWNYLMAASTLVVAPIIALFLVAQRSLIEGIALTGGKS